MRYASANSHERKFFVGRFLYDPKQNASGLQVLGSPLGFDYADDAVAFLDNYKAQRMDETLLLFEVWEDHRVVSRLWRAEPLKPVISAAERKGSA